MAQQLGAILRTLPEDSSLLRAPLSFDSQPDVIPSPADLMPLTFMGICTHMHRPICNIHTYA